MKHSKTTSIFLGLIGALCMISCQGSYVTQNSVFSNKNKRLKESLLGSWQLQDEHSGIKPAKYEFYMDQKKQVKLKIDGQEIEMQEFDGSDEMFFGFFYTDTQGDKIKVSGNFKTYAKRSLVVAHDTVSTSSNTSFSTLSLKRVD